VFYKLIEEYSSIILDYSVSGLQKYDSAYSLVAKVQFIDESVLHIKDYLFLDGKRKYSFQWQTQEGGLISRWDNSPHHKEISTFPHHQHEPYKIVKSHSRNLSEILKIISEIITENIANQAGADEKAG
jgi:hypothetical protein